MEQVAPGVWARLADVGDVAPDRWPALFAQMSPARQAKCRCYRRAEDRALCVLADAVTRQALSQRSGVPPEDIVFDRAPGGKPFAPGLGLEFSLSHSGRLVLCAVAPFPVGADIQRRRTVSDALIRRAVRAGYQGATQAEFFRWWARQEAAGKLTGTGLTFSPLPEGLWFAGAETQAAGETYDYSICAPAAHIPAGGRTERENKRDRRRSP